MHYFSKKRVSLNRQNVLKRSFDNYSQFLIFVALVTDSGTGCIQQRQVFYVFRVVRATTLVSHTSAACSVTSPEEQVQRPEKVVRPAVTYLTVCVLYSPVSPSHRRGRLSNSNSKLKSTEHFKAKSS